VFARRLYNDIVGRWGVMRKQLLVGALGVVLVGCAGRDPQPIATVQAQDQYADCTMIRAEIEANNAKVTQLANEQGWKVAQNVGAGVVGLVIWPVWFGMDFKDAAGKDAAALEARQKYLTVLAEQRCATPNAPARTANKLASPRGRTAKASVRTAPPPQAPLASEPREPEAEPQLAPYQETPH
jgi:hypothetical protein